MSDGFSGFGSFEVRVRRGVGALAACTLLAMACSGGESNGSEGGPADVPADGQAASVEERREILDQANAGQQPAAAPGAPVEAGAAAGAEAPAPILDAVKSDLAQRALASAGEISVVEVSAQEWPDGSLGCPTPGQSYIQMVTSGYRIVLAIGDKQYDYRSTEQGQFVLCDRGSPLPPAADQIKGQAPES